jgi:hypothetical protein
MRYSIILFALFGNACLAQTLHADPTRPPGEGVALGSGGSASVGPRLESVYLPKKGVPRALIDGQLVALGADVGGRRLVRVSETAVTLEGPEGQEKLYLTPDIEIQGRTMKADKRRVGE